MAILSSKRETITNEALVVEISSERLKMATDSDGLATEIVATCDACNDGVEHRFRVSSTLHHPKAGCFHWDDRERRYIVTCPFGHEEKYGQAEVYSAIGAEYA